MSFNPLTGISSILTDLAWRLGPGEDLSFQSPDGDFVYSDLKKTNAEMSVEEKFQSPDGDFVYSDFLCRDPQGWEPPMCFNPLTGISSILTRPSLLSMAPANARFNPLTGISSILTGDALPASIASSFCFNPLTGISSILTYRIEGEGVAWVESFNPLTGISSILTHPWWPRTPSQALVSIP